MRHLQAARGTTLTTTPPEPVSPARRRRLLAIFAGLALAGWTLDLVTKNLALQRLDGQPDVPLIGDLLTLTLVRNPGAAFSLGTEATVFLSMLAIAAVLFILWWSRKLGSLWWAVALGFLLAGISGNLTDRLFRDPSPMRGHVVDMLMLPNWPVFNLADVFINTGGIMVVIAVFRGVEIDGSRAEKREEEPA